MKKTFFIGCILTLASLLSAQQTPSPLHKHGNPGVEIGPIEDLYREHGLLNRILLIYDEIIRRITNNEKFSPTLLQQSASIVHRFIEGYHEKLEEDYIFPRFELNGTHIELVYTLRQQHAMGRTLTEYILHHYRDQDSTTLCHALTLFTYMYRAHESREDTELFPAFHQLITPAEYAKLSDIFEDTEDELFGEHGYERLLEQVATIEDELNIHTLDHYSPDLHIFKHRQKRKQ